MGAVCGFAFFAWLARKIREAKGRSIKPEVLPSKTTILSGTTPHEMSGEISEQLRSFQKLPDSGWVEIQMPNDFLNNVTNKVSNLNTFSVLKIWRTEGVSSSEKMNGVDASWRADCVRPDMHVSQSSWDAEGQGYELDEWIKIENDLFVNFGMWSKVQDNEFIEERSEINNSLLPENVISECLKYEIEYIGLIEVDGISYLFLQTVMREEQDMGMMEQVWVDKNSLIIRKHRLAVYENKSFAAEQITTFIEHTRELPISEPEWLNTDDTNTIVNDSVCVVEHWW